MQKKYVTLFVLVLLLSVKAMAQNVSSPYSILGIGDIESNDYGRYSASGSAAVSRREPGFYNFSNPASLTALPYKAINFDFGFRGRISKFKVPGVDTLTAPSKDFIVKRATIAFKVTPTVAFAFGIKPFSSINYKYQVDGTITGSNGDLTKYTDGSGGMYQTYFSIAKQLRKRLSIGATASWLFGSAQSNVEYYNPYLSLDVVRNETNYYNGPGLQLGLQYYTLPGKKWQQTIGITGTAYTTLKGKNTTNYTESSTTIKTLDPTDIQFKMPLTGSIGYSIANRYGLSLHLQGTYNKWPTQKLDYPNSFTKDAVSFNTGMEYSKRLTTKDYIIEKYYVGWGVRIEQSYLSINNSRINDYAITFGGGKNLSRLLSINGGLEVGRRGASSLNQIQENYTQFNLGLTIKDTWFGTKRFGRYN